MSSTWTNGGFSLSVFGESHGAGIGVVLDSPPAGIPMDMEDILTQMRRRAPGKDRTSTPRDEADVPRILSGVLNGKTTGTPLCAVIDNTDTRSSDYRQMATLARPGHADYTGFVRYNGLNDPRGGGHFSGRLTAPLVFAGAVCGIYLRQKGIYAGAHILAIKDILDTPFDPVGVTQETLLAVQRKPLPLLDDAKAQPIYDTIEQARRAQDSVGGVIECAAIGLPAGIGSPIFDGLENVISSLVFGVPAVKGIEFGNGFSAATLFGSQNNDAFYMDGDTVKTKTNNHGGILGGISSGMPILFRVALKPTPSIAKVQQTVDYKTKTDSTIQIQGRHDPCVVIRAVPVIESCMQIALASMLFGFDGATGASDV